MIDDYEADILNLSHQTYKRGLNISGRYFLLLSYFASFKNEITLLWSCKIGPLSCTTDLR